MDDHDKWRETIITRYRQSGQRLEKLGKALHRIEESIADLEDERQDYYLTFREWVRLRWLYAVHWFVKRSVENSKKERGRLSDIESFLQEVKRLPETEEPETHGG